MPSTSTGSCRRHRSIGGAVRGGEKPDPRRRQQPGSSPWRGRGDPALYRPGRGSLGLGRRREPIPRSHRFLGTADLGSSPGGRHRGTASPAGARLDLWRPDRGRGATGFACFRPHAGDRDAPPCQFRNRGRHVRGPARAGFHRQAQAHQVRRRLPRACRRPACGSRLGRGGAQELYGVTPDLTCLGKVLGGGLPIGGYGGRREIMEQVAPAGPVYQAGTLSGNPLAVAAGLATLDALDDSIYRQLESVGARVAAELASAAAAAGVPLTVNRVGSMLTAFFAAGAITEYATAKQSDTAQFAAWFRSLLALGVSIPPSQFEAAFLSTAHDDDAITFLHSKLEESFTSLLASTTR